MPNVEKLRETLEYIQTHPEEHNQESWAERFDCGTTRCMAGTAVHLSPDHQIVWEDDWSMTGECRNTVTGLHADISSVAEDLLDLTDEQAEWLFGGCVDLRELYEAANEITNGAIEIPSDVVPSEDDDDNDY